MKHTSAKNMKLNLISKPEHSDFSQESLSVTRKGATFGRKNENTHVLPDSEKIISSYHAAISLVDGKFTLTDTSTNGTMVNDIPITFPKTLAHGDIITIGKYQFSVDIEEIAEVNPAPEPSAPQSSFLDDLAHSASDGSQPDPKDTEPAMTANDSFAEFLSPRPIAPPQHEYSAPSHVDELDQWLEPSQNAEPDALAPLQQYQSNDQNITGDEITDPLVAMNQASQNTQNTLSGLIDDADAIDKAHTLNGTSQNDDKWWLEKGSRGDHASAINQAVSPPKQQSSEHFPLENPVSHNTTDAALTAPKSNHPWEIDEIEQNSLDDFLAVDKNASEDLSPAASPAHSLPQFSATNAAELSETDNELDRWLTQGGTGEFNSSMSSPSLDPFIENEPPATSEQPLFSQTEVQKVQTNAVSQQLHHSQIEHALAEQLGLSRLSEQELSNLVPEVSEILKETTTRLLEVLIARSNVKNEMRLERTMIKTRENNPLKFSVSGEDAMQNLLAPRSSAFLSGKAAISEAFDDLADHQIALLSGMRDAYQNMLEQFSPDVFQDIAQTKANSGIFKGHSKAKQWSAYQDFYEELKADQEATYNQLFGDKFNRAYEEKINALKMMREEKRPM